MSTQTKEKTFTPVKNTIAAVRRTRRAYLGLHGMAFERAQERFEQARTTTDKLFGELVSKGETFEGQFKTVSEETVEKARDMIPTVSLPIPAKKAHVKTLETEVADLQAKLKKLTPAKPKKATKKVKPIMTERTVKAAPVKPAAVKAPAVETAAKTAAPVKTEKPADKYEPFFADVLRYDANADAVVVKKIVDHCGIALQSRDGKFVACSDEAERNTVRDSWIIKALRITADAEILNAKVLKVCDMMKDDRMKNRVTFYYLIAKNEGKLTSF